jgi:hypothetical protein
MQLPVRATLSKIHSLEACYLLKAKRKNNVQRAVTAWCKYRTNY